MSVIRTFLLLHTLLLQPVSSLIRYFFDALKTYGIGCKGHQYYLRSLILELLELRRGEDVLIGCRGGRRPVSFLGTNYSRIVFYRIYFKSKSTFK